MPSELLKDYATWKERRAAELNVAKNPDRWMYFEDRSGNKQADWLPTDSLYEIGLQAKKMGIDPLRAISTFVAERGSNVRFDNPGRLTEATRADFEKKQGRPFAGALNAELGREGQTTNFSGTAGLGTEDVRDAYEYAFWKDDVRTALGKLKYAQSLYKDPLSAQQAYSGTGKTIYPGQNKRRAGKWFGGNDLEGYDVWANKPQATKTFAIEKELAKDPMIKNILGDIGEDYGKVDEFFTKFLPKLQQKKAAHKFEKEESKYPYGSF